MRVVAVYLYRDASGQPARRKLRYEPKDFRWQTYHPATGAWTWDARDSKSTVYKLELLAKERPATVFVPEGEQDVLTLIRGLGLPACTSGGAGTWEAHHSRQLREHGCEQAIVLPDHDAPGEESAAQIARHNLACNIPSKIVRLPGLDDAQDVTDWVEQHGGTRARLLELVDATPWITLAELPPLKVSTKRPASSTSTYQHDPRFNGFFFETLKIRPTTGRIKAICPLHPDSNPSLSIDLDRGLWHCFGCAAGGTVVTFYMKVAKLRGRTVTMSEARQRLVATFC
jgi:DNA primase